MNRILSRMWMGSALLTVGLTVASAQSYPNQDGRYQQDGRYEDGRYQQDDGRWRQDQGYYAPQDGRYATQGYGEYRNAFYNRLQGDLDRAASSGYLRGWDLRRFDRARQEINEFQAKWSRGMYDPRALDDAISATQRVANLQGLYGRDREALMEDLSMMRRFRARMSGGYGYRGQPSGYYRPY